MTDPLLAKYGTSRDGHAIFAPSAAASWLTCSGSLLVNARGADNAGIDAAYGTVAHWVAEFWLRQGETDARGLLGLSRTAKAGGSEFAITIDEAMLAAVGEYVRWCQELPGDHFTEQRVDLSELMPIPGQGGTADHIACERGLLTITDLKTGTGVRVYAERNPQALLYAAGAFIEHDWIYHFERIVVRICQPRLGVFETWTCDRAELLDFMEYARERARLAWNELADRTPSPKACRWCKGSVTCPARLRDIERIVDETFDDLAELDREPPSYGAEVLSEAAPLALPALVRLPEAIKPLSTAALSHTLTFRKHVERWFADVADELLDRVERGEKAPHWGLKEGRMTRKWKDEKEAAAYLHDLMGIDYDKIYPPSALVSPAEAEKLLPAETKAKPAEAKKALAPFIHAFAGKRTLGLLKEDERVNVDDVIDQTFTESREDAK